MDDIFNPAVAPTRQYVDSDFVLKTLGIKRSRLYALVKAYPGQLKSISLTMPGKKRGRRLWHLPSLVQFMESSQQQEDEKNHADKA